MAPVVELRDIHHSYGAVETLRAVSFSLGDGEVVGLVGENGAGKSTIVKILTGVVQPIKGNIIVKGTERVFTNPRAAREAGIAAMYQEPTLFPDLSISENIFAGHQLTRRGTIVWSQLHHRPRSVFDKLHFTLDPQTPSYH